MDLFSILGLMPNTSDPKDTENTKKTTKAHYEELKNTIRTHMHAYYDLDEPTISDLEYDALMQELKAIEREHPDWVTNTSPSQVIGAQASVSGVEVTHRVPMLSIEDIFDKEDVVKWVEKVLRIHPDARFVVEPKIDGASLSATYKNGRLVQSELRGDGLIGEVVTDKARCIEGIPEELTCPDGNYPDELEVRGEVYMTHEDFESYSQEMEIEGKKVPANARNLIAGTLRLLDLKEVAHRKPRIFFFNIQRAGQDLLAYHDAGLSRLGQMGLATIPERQVCRNSTEVWAAIEAIGQKRGTFPFDIDGAVVKLDQTAYRKDFPAGSKYSAGHIAYKYPPEEKEVVIETVEVNVGRTGKLTFRAVFQEAVRLCGTSVKRATLHNKDYIEKLGISEGCHAICRKQGEIIPAIVRVTKSTGTVFQPPAVCPVCGSELIKEEDSCDIYCLNPSCPAQLERTVTYFCSRSAYNIKGLGATLIRDLIAEGYILSIADIFSLKEHRGELIRKGILGKEKNTDKLLENIENSKKNNVEMLLTGLAIRNVAQASAKQIMKRFSSIEELSHASITELMAIDDVGEITARMIFNYFRNPANQRIIAQLKAAGLNMSVSESNQTGGCEFEGMTFVVTGTLPTMSRDEATALIEHHGGKCAGSVSAKTSYLVAGEKAGSKLAKAQALNIPVLEESQLLAMINK